MLDQKLGRKKLKAKERPEICLSRSKIPIHCEYWHGLGKSHHRTSKPKKKKIEKKRKAERKSLLLNEI